MKIALSSDSSVDLTKEIIQEYGINVVPFSINMGEKTYLDGEITSNEIFEYVNKTGEIPKTSAVNEFQFENHFSLLLNDYDAIIHISMSSKASSAYQNALNVAKRIKNVYVIDSKNISTGVALACIYARNLIEQNMSVEKIVSLVEKRTSAIRTSFITDKLNYLYKGGRVSGIALVACNLLKIHPQIYMKEGDVFSGKKYHGSLEHAYNKYFEDVFLKRKKLDLSVGFVSYTSICIKGLIEKAVNVMKKIGFKKVYVTQTGATVTTHCGENCLGLLFIDDTMPYIY